MNSSRHIIQAAVWSFCGLDNAHVSTVCRPDCQSGLVVPQNKAWRCMPGPLPATRAAACFLSSFGHNDRGERRGTCHTRTSARCCAQPLTDCPLHLYPAFSPLYDDGTEAQRGQVLLGVTSNWQNWNVNPEPTTSKVPSTSALVGLEAEPPSTPTRGK